MKLQTPSQKTAPAPPVRRRMAATTRATKPITMKAVPVMSLITSPIKRAWACGSEGISRAQTKTE